MTGGTIKGGEYGLKHTQLNEITLSGGTISGAASKSDVYMANGRTGTSGTASFKVNGNFPFSSMQIESASVKNEIDFTKATVTEEEKIKQFSRGMEVIQSRTRNFSRHRFQIIGISLTISHCLEERIRSLQSIMRKRFLKIQKQLRSMYSVA